MNQSCFGFGLEELISLTSLV